MKNLLKVTRLHPVLFAAFFAVFTLLAMTLVSTSVSAQSSATCAIKINIDKCQADVKKCTNPVPDRKDDCIRAAVAKYQDVVDACKDKARPQACDTAVKKDCNKITPDAKKQACIDKRAADFKAQPKTTPGGGGATGDESVFATGTKNFQCGNTKDAVETKFNLGCLGESAPSGTGPIHDMAYTFIRFLSAGVGIIIVISIIAAGIQYSSSEGNPEATQAAKTRIQNSVIGLIIYIFAFSFVQYLVPGGMFAGSMIVPHQLYLERIMELI